MKRTKPRHLYLQIHRDARKVEREAGLDDLPLAARDVLAFIADSDGLVRPTEVVATRRFGTAPTVYSLIAALVNAGWIREADHPEDGRSKVLKVTPLASRMYAKISEAASQIVAGKGAAP